MLGLAQRLLRNGVRHPTLAVVATLLHMTNGRAEERGTVFLGYGEQGELRIEVDKFLDDNFLHIAAAIFHGLAEGFAQLVVVMDIALSVARRRHQGLHHTGEPDLVGSTLKLIKRLGIEILSRAQSQLLGGKVANGATVHGVVHGAGRRNHLNAFALKVEETFGTDGLNLRHNDVGMVLLHNGSQRITVEHGENLALVGNLHGWRLIVTVASNDILASPFGGNRKLLAQFA